MEKDKNVNIKIRKRDGRLADFNMDKIYNAVDKACVAVGYDESARKNVANSVSNRVKRKIKDKIHEAEELNNSRCASTTKTDTYIFDVEEIQDMVIEMLVKMRDTKVSNAYISYRKTRDIQRNANTSLMKTIEEITHSDSKESNLKRDNGNINGDTAMGMMLQYGAAITKEYTDDYLLSKDVRDAVKNGDIYIHDKDFYPMGTLTCCQLPLDKMFKNGFNTGHGKLRTPQSIQSYASLTAIAIQANQNEMHGGQAIPLLDFYLAPGVTKSFRKNFIKITDILCNTLETFTQDSLLKLLPAKEDELWKLNNKQEFITHILTKVENDKKEQLKPVLESIWNQAYEYTDKDTYQAMEGLVHNLNTMHSRAGSQVPFSSVNFGMDTSEEGRMVSKNVLLAQQAGLGEGETPIFPILIFQVKEGVNYNPEDPNYDLFKLAIKVSAKRLFPNFVFVDAPFNLQYYDEKDPETIIATMGCVDGKEVITYKYKENLYVESFQRMWNRLNSPIKSQGLSLYKELSNVEIWDSHSNSFVKCLKIIKNPDMDNWYKISFTNGRVITATGNHPLPIQNKGRVYVQDLEIGDEIHKIKTQYSSFDITKDTDKAWLLGLVLCDSSYAKDLRISLGMDEKDIVEKACKVLEKKTTKNINIVEQKRNEKGNYIDILVCDKQLVKEYQTLFEGIKKIDRKIPNEVFNYSRDAKLAFLAGMIDADGYLNQRNGKSCRVQLGSTNKELAIQQLLLAQSLDMEGKLYENRYNSKNNNAIRYRVEFMVTEDLLKYIISSKKRNRVTKIGKPKEMACRVEKIEFLGSLDVCSYDVTTESDYFDVSGILSHNCRTRVIGNVNGKQTPVGRGNLSFNTINLPRLGIKHGILYRQEPDGAPIQANVFKPYDIYGFKKDLDKQINLCIEALLDRYKLQKSKHVVNFPFLMGQGVWRNSETLNKFDKLESVIDTGTLSVGFIGLAECLVALTGHHHGEITKGFDVNCNKNSVENLLVSDSVKTEKMLQKDNTNNSSGSLFTNRNKNSVITLDEMHRYVDEIEQLDWKDFEKCTSYLDVHLFGYFIIQYMRQRMEEATKDFHLNFSLLATPAESLSFKFTVIDKKKYGIFEGVTDREYYTNSFHVPVYYPINFINKIRIEAPYHALTNAGHITYVEVDGDLCKNLDAFESIIRCMKEAGIGYGSVNHPVDRDPVCGYTGVIEGNICPGCGRDISIQHEHTDFIPLI